MTALVRHGWKVARDLKSLVITVSDSQVDNLGHLKDLIRTCHFLDNVSIKLTDSERLPRCGPPHGPCLATSSHQSTGVSFCSSRLALLIFAIDKSAKLTFDPPLHPTYDEPLRIQRERLATDRSMLREYGKFPGCLTSRAPSVTELANPACLLPR